MPYIKLIFNLEKNWNILTNFSKPPKVSHLINKCLAVISFYVERQSNMSELMFAFFYFSIWQRALNNADGMLAPNLSHLITLYVDHIKTITCSTLQFTYSHNRLLTHTCKLTNVSTQSSACPTSLTNFSHYTLTL